MTCGRVPGGMQQDRPAEPLDGPGGCYVVQAVAGGAGGSKSVRTGFRVGDGGSVRELTPAQIDSIVKVTRGGTPAAVEGPGGHFAAHGRSCYTSVLTPPPTPTTRRSGFPGRTCAPSTSS